MQFILDLHESLKPNKFATTSSFIVQRNNLHISKYSFLFPYILCFLYTLEFPSALCFDFCSSLIRPYIIRSKKTSSGNSKCYVAELQISCVYRTVQNLGLYTFHFLCHITWWSVILKNYCHIVYRFFLGKNIQLARKMRI